MISDVMNYTIYVYRMCNICRIELRITLSDNYLMSLFSKYITNCIQIH